MQIVEDIKSKIAGSPVERAVFVFFESDKELTSFRDSPNFDYYKKKANVLTEVSSIEEKENFIKLAASSGTITLFTRSFGRGTDFISTDENFNAAGGTHVIQTFVSDDPAEEVQIKGRTARQGGKGSYSMVLSYSNLEKFGIQKQDLENKSWREQLDLIKNQRESFFSMTYDDLNLFVERAVTINTESWLFLNHIRTNDKIEINNFLLSQNKGPAVELLTRTICLMDATGSMSKLLNKAKNNVGIMFERAKDILKQNKLDPNTINLKFIAYRNYSSGPEKIIQESIWTSNPDELRDFLGTVSTQGGQGNEAVEIGLWHANEENDKQKIDQIILIGDMPPNTKKEVKTKRKSENTWARTKYSNPTYYEDEVKKLAQSSVKINAFYLDNNAQAEFSEISKKTGGRCEYLDVNDQKKGADNLVDVFTEELLRMAGNSSIVGGDNLVKQYQEKYRKGYLKKDGA